MTYPTGEDFDARDEFAAREAAEHEARTNAAYLDLESTGVCTFRVLGSDQVSVACVVCRHATTAHPGVTNPDPDLTGCVTCHVKVLATSSAALRPHRRLLERRGEVPLCCPDWPICSH